MDLSKFKDFCEQQAQTTQQTAPDTGVCPLCNGKGYTFVEIKGYNYVKACSCQRERRLREQLKAANIPPKYWNTTLQEKPQDGRRPFSIASVRKDPVALASLNNALNCCRMLHDDYLRTFKDGVPNENMTGLLLFGPAGRGKTRMVSALLVDLIHAGLTHVRFIEYNELFKKIRFSMNSSELSYEAIFKDLLSAKVLVVDDLLTAVGSNLIWILDNISYIINERYVRNLPTLFTTNHWYPLAQQEAASGAAKRGGAANPYSRPSHETNQAAAENEAARKDALTEKEVKDQISYRLRSRICEMCHEVELEGYDYRKKLGRNNEMNRIRRTGHY